MPLRALFIDFNSYFASVEQHLRPELRGRPVAVIPVEAETTCCIAASYEAKAFGVKTGTRVSDARRLCPGITLVAARPSVYVETHHRLVAHVESLIHVEEVLSIDEMWCELTGRLRERVEAEALARRIKATIAEKIGVSLRCSIGIAPNPFLGKTATDMQKPDGLVIIEEGDLPDCLHRLELRDLSGIGSRMEARLKLRGIRTVKALCAADAATLRKAWGGSEGERMHLNLRGGDGWRAHQRDRSLGHSHVLPPEKRNGPDALAVLHRLLQKAAMRLRAKRMVTSGLTLTIRATRRAGSWAASVRFPDTNDTLRLTAEMLRLWEAIPPELPPPMFVGVSFFHLRPATEFTPDLFADTPERAPLDEAIDRLNARYGRDTIFFGGAFGAQRAAPMRIAFNRIPDLVTEGDDFSDSETGH